MRTVKLVVLAALLVCPRLALSQTIGGTLPGPLPLFPPANWWNIDVSGAPVDGMSSTFISFIGGNTTLHPDFGGYVDPGPPPSVGIYGFPYITVTNGQSLVSVQFDYDTESDAGPYPIPSQAINQPHWIEGGEPGNQQPGGDRHMLMVNTDTKVLYELYNVRYVGGGWQAGSGAIFDMNTNNRRTEGWTSADAGGLAILPGLLRRDEVFPANGTDEINHAFRVTIHDTANSHVYPASHTACNGCPSNAPPMGARMRLKAGVDVTSCPSLPGGVCPPEIQRIFRAFKKYGLLIADNGSDMYVSGSFDPQWDNDVLNPAFAALKASDFEFVQLGYRPLDLQLTTIHAPDPPQVGQQLQYQVTVKNDDPDTQVAGGTATNVVLTDTIPANVTFNSVSGGCTQNAGVVTCAIGSLAPQTSLTVFITVTPNQGGVLTNTATVTGSQDDPVLANNTSIDTATAGPLPQASIDDVTVSEGDSGTTGAVFTVTLDMAWNQPITVGYATANGTATTADGDYVSTSGTLSFAPNVTSQTLAVAVNGDTTYEADETFAINLSNPSGATIDDGQGLGTITNDDAPPDLAVADATVSEGDAGFVMAFFNVTLSPASGQTATVDYATTPGTAVAGADYVTNTGTLTFLPGETSRTVAVRVLGDGVLEANETFTLDLTNPQNAALVDAQGLGTILDDDTLPSLAIGNAAVAEGNSGTTSAVFTVTLSATSGSPVTVDYATAAGTARPEVDYLSAAGTLTFAPGQTARTLSVAVIGDVRHERNEAFLVRLSNPSGAKLADGEAQGTILNDDGLGDTCTPIASVPFTVTTPGSYCLARSITTSLATGAAIDVESDGVSLDFQGKTLRSTAGVATQAYGVFASQRKNVVVRNGTLRGFFTGVFLGQNGPYPMPQGHSVSSLRVLESTFTGIQVEGRGDLVSLCTVQTTGGTTALGPDSDVFGIVAQGPATRVSRNLVSGLEAAGAGTGYGIVLRAGDGAQAARNRIGNTAAVAGTGLRASASAGVAADTNRLSRFAFGIVFDAGTTGSHAGNTFLGVATPYVGP